MCNNQLGCHSFQLLSDGQGMQIDKSTGSIAKIVITQVVKCMNSESSVLILTPFDVRTYPTPLFLNLALQEN